MCANNEEFINSDKPTKREGAVLILLAIGTAVGSWWVFCKLL
jgi:hypothetical protein